MKSGAVLFVSLILANHLTTAAGLTVAEGDVAFGTLSKPTAQEQDSQLCFNAGTGKLGPCSQELLGAVCELYPQGAAPPICDAYLANTAFTYTTTSARGDYSEWTLTGSLLEATWQVVREDGAIDYTYDFSATCGDPDSRGIRNCTVSASSCVAGVSTCPAPISGTFSMMDVGGVALFVEIVSSVTPELHVGFVKDNSACSQDVTGDYTFIRTGLGLDESFGVYRSDSNFIQIKQSDFGFDTPDANATTQTVAYRTITESETLTDEGCTDGVRLRSKAGGSIMRSMMTSRGLFVLDFPAGEGGQISFKIANAATLGDFAGKSFGGISFPDNSAAEFVNAVFGSFGGTYIDTEITVGSETGNLKFMPLATPSTDTNPAYPDFTISPPGYGASVLSDTYPNPSAIPGLFKLGGLYDDGRVIIAAVKYNSKVIGVGMVYNYRTTSDTNPASGVNFGANGLYNTGNFIIFER